MDRALHDGLAEFAEVSQPSLLLRLVIREIEIEQHEDPGLGIDPEQGDEPDPDPDAHVVTEEVEQPDRADGGERHCQDDDHGLDRRLGVQIEQQEDQDDGHRQHDLELLPHPQHGLVLAAPAQRVARRNLELFAQHRVRLVDKALRVAIGEIDVDVACREPVVVADHPGSAADRDFGKLVECDLPLIGTHRNQDPAHRVDIGAVIGIVANVDREALAALDRRGDVLAAHRRGEDILRLTHADAVAGEFLAIPVDIEEVAAGGALGVDAARAADGLEVLLDLDCDLLDGFEVGA